MAVFLTILYILARCLSRESGYSLYFEMEVFSRCMLSRNAALIKDMYIAQDMICVTGL